MNLKHASLGLVALAGIGLGALTTPAMAATCDTDNLTTSTACVAGLPGGGGGNVTTAVMNNNAAFGQTNWTSLGKIDLPSTGGSVFSITTSAGNTIGTWSLANGFTFESGRVYAIALKGSTNNAVYLLNTAFTSGNWNNIDIVGGLSNITLFEAAVPLPAAAWLFGSALLGLAGIGYRRKRVQVA